MRGNARASESKIVAYCAWIALRKCVIERTDNTQAADGAGNSRMPTHALSPHERELPLESQLVPSGDDEGKDDEQSGEEHNLRRGGLLPLPGIGELGIGK